MHTLQGKVRTIQGPEPLPNGGVKFYVTLDDGSSLVTFSKNCSKELLGHLDEPVEFLLEAPPDATTTPRIEKATLVIGGAVLYDRAAAAARAPGAQTMGMPTVSSVPQAASGNGKNYFQDETTRAVEFAMGYLSDMNIAIIAKTGEPMALDLFIAKLSDLSNLIHEQILDLRKPHPSVAALKQEAEEKLASVPAGWI